MSSLRRTILVFLSAVLITACQKVDTTGLSPESSRQPKGSPTALVTVVEFSDLQCPACKSAHELITQPILQKYGAKISFQFKHFPLLQLHENALEAAEGAECAADQGKFWEFVDLNYSQQDKLSPQALRDWAKALGLDVPLFDRCIRSGIKSATIMADEAEGQKLNVEGTPTFFVNGAKITENTVLAVGDAIDQALKQVANTPL
jgi:protein-disulfide isomerase